MAISLTQVRVGLGVALLVGAVGVTSWAQGLVPSSSGSLSELTAELKQLRLTVQEAGRNSTQMQAVNMSLTSQLSRLTQVSARVDAGQAELEKATERTQAILRGLTELQAEVVKVPATQPAERARLDEMVKDVRAQLDRAQEAENRLQARHTELLNTFRFEETRWNELVAKLEEIIKR